MSSRIYGMLEKDSLYMELRDGLLNEFDGNGIGIYYKIMNNVLDLLSNVDNINSNINLNRECWILIEDIAMYGICRYPWDVIKMLIIIIWGNIFDELYELDNFNSNIILSIEDYQSKKLNLFSYILNFNVPPFTLQRLCEIPIKQPYKVSYKLHNAYRKLFNTRPIEYEPVNIPKHINLDDFKLLDTIKHNLHKWTLQVQQLPQWDNELWGNISDDESID